MSEKKPNPYDIHVGGRLRQRRAYLGMSQEKLGEKLGLTFQQVQKYEKGSNRIGAGRLFEIANILEVPVSFFYAGLVESPAPATGFSEAQAEFAGDDRADLDQGVRLTRAFSRIKDRNAKKIIVELTETLANAAH